MQSLSPVYDHDSAAEKQDAVEAASQPISLETEREDMDEGLTGQDIREQGEGGAASADRASRNRNQNVKAKKNRKRRVLIKPQQVEDFAFRVDEALCRGAQRRLSFTNRIIMHVAMALGAGCIK